MSKKMAVPGAITVRHEGNTKETAFGEFLRMALDAYNPLGHGTSNIRKAVKIHEKVEGINGAAELVVEDEEHRTIKAAVEAMEWNPAAARQMIPFFDAVEKAEDGEAKKADAGKK
jgi:hypothetical protein